MNVLYLQYEELWKVQYRRWEEGEWNVLYIVDQ